MTTDQVAAAITDLTGDYDIDPAHSRLGFVVRHAMVTKVRGQFRTFSGNAHLDAANPQNSTAYVEIEMNSIDTGHEQRDGHLRGNDFFDVHTHAKATFQSTAVDKTGAETFRMTGELTIKGVTRPVTLDWEFTGSAQDPSGNLRAGFDGSATVNRKDWGIEWNAALETGGVLVSDKIGLELDVSAVRIDGAGNG
jgi:polyisoprenoid-binding protein YceI